MHCAGLLGNLRAVPHDPAQLNWYWWTPSWTRPAIQLGSSGSCSSTPLGRWCSREKLAFKKAAWVYSLYSRVYTVYTLYKLLTVHPTGLNFCTLCTLLLEHSRMFQNPNHSFVYETSPTNRWLEEEEKENCHLLTMTRRTDKGRGKKELPCPWV